MRSEGKEYVVKDGDVMNFLSAPEPFAAPLAGLLCRCLLHAPNDGVVHSVDRAGHVATGACFDMPDECS